MSRLIIEGGNSLSGDIYVNGSKNITLPLIAASILTDENVELINVPNIDDVYNMLHLFLDLKGNITLNGDSIIEYNRESYSLILNAKKIENGNLETDLVKKLRASIVFLGPLLARFQDVKISLPGGCAIGARPIDIHIDGLTKMGAKIEIKDNYLHAKGKLKGCELTLRMQSVGATQNLLMASVFAEGTTIINNASNEPEVNELAKMLLEMGAKIKGIETDKLIIEGIKTLNGAKFIISQDRMEAASYVMLIAATNGNGIMKNFNKNILNFCEKELYDAGIKLMQDKEDVLIQRIERKNNLEIITKIYPNFATDIQPIMTAFLSIHEKPYYSTVIETLYENRFMIAKELLKMDAKIDFINDKMIKIQAVKELMPSDNLISQDLRTGFALLTASLATKGKSIIHNAESINRGYANFISNIQNLGGKIKYIQD